MHFILELEHSIRVENIGRREGTVAEEERGGWWEGRTKEGQNVRQCTDLRTSF
jgi:hypothetical protein